MTRPFLITLLATLVAPQAPGQAAAPIVGVLDEGQTVSRALQLSVPVEDERSVRGLWRLDIEAPQVVTVTLRSPHLWETTLSVGRWIDGRFAQHYDFGTQDRVLGFGGVDGLRKTLRFDTAGAYLVGVVGTLTPDLQRIPITLQIHRARAATEGAHVFPVGETVLAAFDIPNEQPPRHRDWVFSTSAARRVTVTASSPDDPDLYFEVGTLEDGAFRPLPGNRSSRRTVPVDAGRPYVVRVNSAREGGVGYSLRIAPG